MHLRFLLFIAVLLVDVSPLTGGTVTLTQKGPATAWSRLQQIAGTVSPGASPSGTLSVNGVPYAFTIAADAFSATVILPEGTSSIVASVDSAGTTWRSDTLILTLGYNLRPEIEPRAVVSGGSTVSLRGSVVENPDTAVLAFLWTARASNPATITLTGSADSVAGATIGPGSPDGEYYFDLCVTSSRGDTVRGATIVTKSRDTLRAFTIRKDHARWIDSAVIYCVSPFMFTGETRLPHITAKLPEIRELGATAIWIQPIYPTSDPDQGYHVLNYFGIRSSLGNEAELRTLVTTAHQLGMRVLLDFTPNHGGVQHPYAQDAIANGPRSHYYDFYQRDVIPGQYSSAMYKAHAGQMDFIQYFSGSYDPVYFFPSWNASNPEFQRMLIEAGKYWIEKFGVDGYRLDAVWAVNDRNPQLMKDFRLALKRVKPDVLILAEDKASWPSTFAERADAAYDWSSETSWVSHWPWQITYTDWSQPSKTIFNATPEAQRGAQLASALTNRGVGFPAGAKVLRFMENNDLPHFLAHHSLDATRMAAALLFTLDGIPLLFNGQEVGATSHPYNATPIFSPSATMRSMDRVGLFGYYSSLTGMRRHYPALMEGRFELTPLVSGPGSLLAFRRSLGAQNVFTVLNMGSSQATAAMAVPVQTMGLDSLRTYYLTDLLTGQVFSGTPQVLDTVSMLMVASSARILVLDTTAVTGVGWQPGETLPGEIALEQNYPNPFNPTTTIRFQMPVRARARLLVYDMLGRQAALLLDGMVEAGTSNVVFDASRLATGAYIVRLQAEGRVFTRKMLLIK